MNRNPAEVAEPTRSVLMTLAMASGTGAGQVVLQYSKGLRREGWHVVIACGPPPASEGNGMRTALEALGVEVRQLDRVVAPTWPVWRQLITIAQDVQPTVVIGVGQRDRAVAMALSRRLGVPGIVTAQNQHVFWGSVPVSLAKRAIYGYALRHWASLVICTSEPVRQEIHDFGVPESRTIVLPNGVSLRAPIVMSETDRAAIRTEFGASSDDVLLINVGRLDIQKGQDILIDAFAECASRRPWLRLVLVGDVSAGPNRKRMASFAKAVKRSSREKGLDDQVTFAGWRSDIPHLLSAADAYVHAARWEGFAFAVLEAMAASIPVVITDCSGRPDSFCEGEQGWMVPKGEAGPLAVAMARLADLSPARRLKMGRAARHLVEAHYDVEAIGLRFAHLVQDAASGVR